MEPINLDAELLQAALLGYERQLEEIQIKMAPIRACLARARTVENAPETPALAFPLQYGQRKRRQMTAETKARIAAAQRARWEKRKQTAATNPAAIDSVVEVG